MPSKPGVKIRIISIKFKMFYAFNYEALRVKVMRWPRNYLPFSIVSKTFYTVDKRHKLNWGTRRLNSVNVAFIGSLFFRQRHRTAYDSILFNPSEYKEQNGEMCVERKKNRRKSNRNFFCRVQCVVIKVDLCTLAI